MNDEIKAITTNTDGEIYETSIPEQEENTANINGPQVEEKETFNPQDYAIIRDMMKEMDEWNQMLKDETHSILKNTYGLTNFAIVGIIPYTDEKIEAMTLDEIKAFFEKYRQQNTNNEPVIETLEDGIKLMKEVKELQMNLYSADQESSKLKEQIGRAHV